MILLPSQHTHGISESTKEVKLFIISENNE